MRFTGTVCRMCKNSLRFSFVFFGVALRNFIKYIYYKYKAFFLSQLKAIKKIQSLSIPSTITQVNQSNSFSFWKRITNQYLGCSKAQQKPV